MPSADADRLRCAAHPGYAGVGMPGELPHCGGRQRSPRPQASLLTDLHLEVRPQPEGLEAEETGQTFAENARIKAVAVALASGAGPWRTIRVSASLPSKALPACSQHLGGRRRRADRPVAAELEVAYPRRAQAGLREDRTARYTAALAVADPRGLVRLAVEGYCPRMLPGPHQSGPPQEESSPLGSSSTPSQRENR